MRPPVAFFFALDALPRRSRELARCGFLAVASCGLAGCGSKPPPSHPPVVRPVVLVAEPTPPVGLPTLAGNVDLKCRIDPPLGWKLQVQKADARHVHKIWLSPTGSTVYGVIYFHLPFPVGSNFALYGFLQQMKQAEGAATLVSRSDDPQLPGIRFVADGVHYRLRVNLTTQGFQGWAAYAGTRLSQPENAAELRLSEAARDRTQFPAR